MTKKSAKAPAVAAAAKPAAASAAKKVKAADAGGVGSKPAADAGSSGSGGNVGGGDGLDDNVAKMNAQLLADVADAKREVLADAAFKNVATDLPPPIDKKLGEWSGIENPFEADEYKVAVGARGQYKCAGNACWIDEQKIVMRGTPFNRKSVNDIVVTKFKSPVPLNFVVAVEDEVDPSPYFMTLESPSPEEVRFGLWLAIRRDLGDKALKKQWRHYLVTSSLWFIVLETEEKRYFKAFELRDDIAKDYKTLALTPFQKMMTVWCFKVRRERNQGRMSSKEVFMQYEDHCNLDKTEEEPLSESFVDASITTMTRAMVYPAIAEALQWIENEHGISGPLASVYKYEAIIKKAKTPEDIIWAFVGGIDMFRRGLLGHCTPLVHQATE